MFLEEVATLIAQAGTDVTVPGGTLFFNHMPVDPDECIVLFETQGVEGDQVLDTPGTKYERPRCQVMVRGASYVEARSRIEAVYKTLDTVVNQSVNGTCYLKLRALQPPFYLDRDDNDRFLMVFNLEALKTLS